MQPLVLQVEDALAVSTVRLQFGMESLGRNRELDADYSCRMTKWTKKELAEIGWMEDLARPSLYSMRSGKVSSERVPRLWFNNCYRSSVKYTIRIQIA